MEINFQLLDCDYVLVGNNPVVRLFGITKDNKSVCAFHKGVMPYFYVLPKDENSKLELVGFLKKNFGSIVVDIKEVEKSLPMGYQKSKTKLLKIILNNPAQTPVVRDQLVGNPFVKDVFEADILFKYRFMADKGLSGMKWYTVTGNNASTSTVKSNKKIDITAIKEHGTDENVQHRYMSIDIEIASTTEGLPNSKKDQIAMISLSFLPQFQGKSSVVLVAKPIKAIDCVLSFKNERGMLEEFLDIFEKFDPDIITGYNINNFDMPYIIDRLVENKLPRTIGRCNQKPTISKKFGIRTRNTITGRVLVDVYELVKESIGKGLLRFKRYGLGDVAKELLGEEKIDVAHSEITKYWNGTEEQQSKLIEYSRKDSQLALRLLLEKNMLDKFIELSKVSGLLLQDVLDGGEAVRVENLLLREFNKNDIVIPLKPSHTEIYKRMDERETHGLKGALVLEPAVGIHTNSCVYLDFKAMYPSIFISYNICPTTLILDKNIPSGDIIKTPYGTEFVSKSMHEGVLPKILKFLIDERDKIKSQLRKASTETDKRILDAKQLALKIMSNAFYGYTGYIRARLYILDIANAITSCGRYLIQQTREIAEKDETVNVVYGDTDSVIVKTPTKDLDEAYKIGKMLEQKINDELKGVIQVKIESLFKTLLILTKKRYAGLSMEKRDGEWEEKIIMKGIETVRRDWCDLTGETLYETLKIILEEQNPQKSLNYVKTVLLKLEKGQIPIDKLIVTKSISKSLKEYKGMQPHVELVKKMRKRNPAEAPGIGDRIGFVIIQGSQLMSERAEDPEYVKAHGLRIDSKYYVESQILPPLERVLEAIGVNKTDILAIGRQTLLSDAIKNKNTEPIFNSIENFVCAKCDKIYSRPPLIGKCDTCGGEILFQFNNLKSRYFSP